MAKSNAAKKYCLSCVLPIFMKAAGKAESNVMIQKKADELIKRTSVTMVVY